MCLGIWFTNGNCMLSANWLLAFFTSRFYFAHWIFSWFMPFSMRCNNAHFTSSWRVIIWRGLLYFIVFSSKYMCDWVLQMFWQTPYSLTGMHVRLCKCFHKLPPKFKTAYILFSVVLYINSLAVYTSHVKHVLYCN